MEIKIGKTTDVEKEVSATSAPYQITANVRVSDNLTEGINVNNGIVVDGSENIVANFSYYGRLSVTFSVSASASDGMTDILSAVRGYVEECKNERSKIGADE